MIVTGLLSYWKYGSGFYFVDSSMQDKKEKSDGNLLFMSIVEAQPPIALGMDVVIDSQW